MNKEIYQIKRAFIVPLSVLLTLCCTLLAIAVFQGQPNAKVIVLGTIIVPVFIVLLESLFREISIDEEGITLKKLMRSKRFLFDQVTSFDIIVVKKRAFASLSTEEDFLLFSNAYAGFTELLNGLQSKIPQDKIPEESREQLATPPEKSSDIISCWVAVVLLIIIIAVQF